MTTTHTFQGLNADNKPSSRVLNPPGGSSSNIFGFDDQPKKQDSAKIHPEGATKGNDAASHAIPAATAGPQQKSGVPKSGDDSLHTPLGINQSSGYDKAPCYYAVVAPVAGFQGPRLDTVGRNYPRSKYSDANTFVNLFGDGIVQQRKMLFRKIHTSDDSFTRVFGQKSLLDSREVKERPEKMSTGKLESDVKAGHVVEVPIKTSLSNPCNVSRFDKAKDDGALPVSEVFLRNVACGKALSRRLSPPSAFNPITGEPYEQSKPKQETPAPAAVVSESKLAVESNSVVESSAAVNIAESDKTQPATTPAATSASVPQQQKKQHQNGPFGVGSNEDPKEHRSTRVTQPPGGRSTKLW
ncbi:hypothetical protein BsWGS_27239 [Bradybaena similaris]